MPLDAYNIHHFRRRHDNIAPFLVNAVLHYVQCSETPDVSHMRAENPHPLLDRNAVENIVVEILRQQQTKYSDEVKENLNKKELMSFESIEPQIMINDDI